MLILDEAIAVLDVSIQAQVPALLADVRATTGTDVRATTGTVLLVITHGLGAVRHISDDPQHPYTRRLIESVPKQGWKPRRRV
ncbi:ABC transporter ATP-binding protein [Streptomyces sp. NBC_01283]|uniref:ABC transporter ATP-binding protein n=1 Tax=Streptomyces sp. NBC_01283 TaxID=2903812 RepID=UPI00352D64AE